MLCQVGQSSEPFLLQVLDSDNVLLKEVRVQRGDQ
jgi:hypothetical protein